MHLLGANGIKMVLITEAIQNKHNELLYFLELNLFNYNHSSKAAQTNSQ